MSAINIRDDNDIKVLILYLLKNLEIPLDFDTLCEVIFTIDFVRHFDFTDQFADLLDRGLINEITVEDKRKYIISTKGKIALEGMEDTLLNLVKQKALTAATRFLEYKDHGFMIIAYIEKTLNEEDDGVMLHCIIKDNLHTILNMETYVGSRIIAEKMKLIFEKRAEKLLSQFHALMSEDMLLL